MSQLTITNVMAISLDGYIASAPGETDANRRAIGFTDDVDRQHLRKLVRSSDAIIAGAETVRVARRLFADQNDLGEIPVWLIPTQRGLDNNLPLWEQRQVRKILVTKNLDLKVPDDANVLRIGNDGMPLTITRYLSEQNLHRVLLLGGAEINRSFYQERLVDHVIITVCPIILGDKRGIPLLRPGLPAHVRLKLNTSHSIGNLVFLSYSVIDQ